MGTAQSSDKPQRIVVLGGGCGALAAVFALTRHSNWRERYDITVYERGWRLGGKGASGVNENHCFRIEEHGLHVWSGFYENAFWIMRECYKELNRSSSEPLSTWQEAFHRHDYGGFKFRQGENWLNWTSYLPHDPGLPGDVQIQAIEKIEKSLISPCQNQDANNARGNDQLPTPWDFWKEIISWALSYLISAPRVEKASNVENDPNKLGSLLFTARHSFTWIWESILSGFAFALLRLALFTAEKAAKDPSKHWKISHYFWRNSVKIAQVFVHNKLNRLSKQPPNQLDNDQFRLYILADIVLALMKGMIADHLITKGFDHIDCYELKEWFRRHNTHATSLDSPAVEAAYSYLFAFVGGQYEAQNLAAGTGLRMILRLLFASRGSVFWKMQAGMGDAVFAPLYQVLMKRGVKFHFFHRVQSLKSHDGISVDEIHFAKQADIVDSKEYDPLIDVKGLPCWPSQPRYEQLVQGAEMQNHYINRICDIDNAYTDWKDVGQFALHKNGKDDQGFDRIIFGVSLGAVPYICKELLPYSHYLNNAVTHVKTIRTQSMQLWFTNTIEELGWKLPSAILTTYGAPFDTWADMSHLLKRENWPKESNAHSLAYLCGPMPDDHEIEAPSPNRQLIESTRQMTFASARDWLQQYSNGLWPLATEPGALALNYALLATPNNAPKDERLAQQWFKANIDPSDRYVLSVCGSTDHRPACYQSGFDNMVLTGDWLRNGINYGCVESAVVSGLQAARYISDNVPPMPIYGETDIPRNLCQP